MRLHFFYAARILRAIRIAARLGFRISRETAHSVKDLSGSVARLDKVVKAAMTFFIYMHSLNNLFAFSELIKGRLLMEVNYMLAYGSAEASLRLLWRFGLLEIVLPIQVLICISNSSLLVKHS